MKKLIISFFAAAFLSGISSGQDVIDSSGMFPLTPEAFKAVKAFFRYDSLIPVDGRVLERYETRVYTREKIVFTGVRGDRVSGYLAIPKIGSEPYPIVLQFHIGAGSKESWWDALSFERGYSLTDTLLRSGIALLALDAQYHGERSINNDYLPLQQMLFEQKWFYRYREGIIQTVGDYFRAIDYLCQRKEIDTSRIGVVGHSIGGVMAVLVAALDPRVKAVVAAVAAHSEPWLYPITPINLAQGVTAPTLLLAGKSDNVVSPDLAQVLLYSLASEVKEIEFYESGHRLPEENITRTALWFSKYLLGQ